MVTTHTPRLLESPLFVASFTVPGKPVGKQRPRVTRGGTRTYTPRATRDFERAVSLAAMAAGIRGVTSPVALHVVAVVPRPKRRPSHVPPELWGDGWVRRAVGMDGDNVLKAVADGLQRSVSGVPAPIRDDSQVVEAHVATVYAEAGKGPRVEVVVEWEDNRAR